ncbi:DUF2948 family protein [Sneathiella sp. P13V-1]|uniref:DUF2948 family protein n=1 Tax=Sneathiella sp. P13V-1 TaxID=2697366 RepID=UPI00187BB818|nr:DUF2948 family protein [Sneathiella sp. P13V-1]MBE7635252.1 DUF2948 family protein [Sneathiella sp. P13V-1]
MGDGLKLKAMEADEVNILSAAMEGAITSPGEISYSPKGRHFTMTCSRFMWEDQETSNQRIRSGLFISDILAAKRQNVPEKPETAMELLSIEAVAGDDGLADLTLTFAGNCTIALSVECVDMTLTDVGDAWKTDAVPHHDLEKEQS